MKKLWEKIKAFFKAIKDKAVEFWGKVVEFWNKVKESARHGMLRKMWVFLVIFVLGVGCIGTIGYLIYLKKWFILLGALGIDYLASGRYIKLVKELLEDEEDD